MSRIIKTFVNTNKLQIIWFDMKIWVAQSFGFSLQSARFGFVAAAASYSRHRSFYAMETTSLYYPCVKLLTENNRQNLVKKV